MVRAKFYVTSISEPKQATKFLGEGKTEQVVAYDIMLAAVTANGSVENAQFFTNTPTGSLTMNTVNEEAAKQFVVGKEYYIDFTEAGIMAPEETKFDNEGNVRTFSRAERRRKPMRPRNVSPFGYVNVPSNAYTKSTNKIKKERLKHAPSKQQRIRSVAKARKARKADYSQVS